MTTATTEPDWKQNWQPDADAPTTGNPNWRKGMKSPNPSGRPKGIVDKRQKVTQAMLNDAHEIANVVVAKAKEGDLHAASLILSRVLPTLSAQSEKVQFDLDTSAPLATQVEQVLAAMADGELSTENAERIIKAIGALGAVRQMDELEQRLAALEGR